ncbi:MAG: methyltransferase domain-containing protein [Anaerolineae bacterium]
MGPTGRVIGVDTTPATVRRARANARRAGVDNVVFRLAEIEAMPVDADSVDMILANCVINLVADKAKAFLEMRRVLKPRGRFCITNILSRGKVPAQVRADPRMWNSCLAGAMNREQYLALLACAGFVHIHVAHEHEHHHLKGEGFAFLSATVMGAKPV